MLPSVEIDTKSGWIRWNPKFEPSELVPRLVPSVGIGTNPVRNPALDHSANEEPSKLEKNPNKKQFKISNNLFTKLKLLYLVAIHKFRRFVQISSHQFFSSRTSQAEITSSSLHSTLHWLSFVVLLGWASLNKTRRRDFPKHVLKTSRKQKLFSNHYKLHFSWWSHKP